MNARRHQRNQTIRAMYEQGRRDGFTSSHLIEKLSAQHYLSPDTIEAIVWQAGRYKTTETTNEPNPLQLDIF